ncbi:DNA cytosine methyltransferase [bacterium]|nr:DNA cytosine methyltransferase [bacterium]
MKIISLFAGCGGLDLGLKDYGHNLIWANDNDKNCVETYEKNISQRIILKDIYDLDIDSIPKGDVVVGGFPCQGFSIANPYRTVEDKRNLLFVPMAEIIKSKRPKYFIGENVQGLTNTGGYETSADKKNKTGRMFKLVLREFSNSGYKVFWEIIDVSKLGVPQKRKRIIIFGIRKDLFDKRVPKLFYSDTEAQVKTIRDAISDLPKDFSDTIPNHTGTKHKVKINGYIGNRATKWDEPSPTIVGRGGGTGGPVIIPHPDLHRRLSIRECARIQTFPDDFIFQGSNSSQYRQIGNAVPVKLGYYLGRLLDDYDNKNTSGENFIEFKEFLDNTYERELFSK